MRKHNFFLVLYYHKANRFSRLVFNLQPVYEIWGGDTLDEFLSARPPENLREELEACNTTSACFGLLLTEVEIERLAQSRHTALRKTGRVEFGGGVLRGLVQAFCDSPYLDNREYADTLEALQELFYDFKNECGECLKDDELQSAMRLIYDGSGGSLDYLSAAGRDILLRAARSGFFEIGDDD